MIDNVIQRIRVAHVENESYCFSDPSIVHKPSSIFTHSDKEGLTKIRISLENLSDD